MNQTPPPLPLPRLNALLQYHGLEFKLSYIVSILIKRQHTETVHEVQTRRDGWIVCHAPDKRNHPFDGLVYVFIVPRDAKNQRRHRLSGLAWRRG